MHLALICFYLNLNNRYAESILTLATTENFRRQMLLVLKGMRHIKFPFSYLMSFSIIVRNEIYCLLKTIFCRTRCNACRLIAEDIEMVDRSLAKNVTLKSVLSDEFCSSLGYRYYPYQWLETVCEDMIEDKLSKFV